MATGAILAVAIAVLTSTTLTPAVLATFGKAAAKRSSWLHFSRRPDTTQSRFWTRWVGWVMRRPWLSAAAATAFLLTIAAPAFAMTLGNSLQRQFEPTHEIRAASTRPPRHLGWRARPGAGARHVPDAHRQRTAERRGTRRVHQKLAQAPDVVTVTPPVFSDDNHSALLSAVLSVDPEDMGARMSIDWMRQNLPGTAGQRVSIDVGGHRADQGLRRPGGRHPAPRCSGSSGDRLRHAADLDQIGVPCLQGRADDVLSVGAAYGSLVAVFEWDGSKRLASNGSRRSTALFRRSSLR